MAVRIDDARYDGGVVRSEYRAIRNFAGWNDPLNVSIADQYGVIDEQGRAGARDDFPGNGKGSFGRQGAS